MHRVLIVFSRKPLDVMEYRRSVRRIMSKTNEARRNKRASPFLCVGEGFASVLLSCEKNGGRIFPRSPPRRAESLLSSRHSSLSSSPRSHPRGLRSCMCPSFSHVYQKGRERTTTKGWQSAERNYGKARRRRTRRG